MKEWPPALKFAAKSLRHSRVKGVAAALGVAFSSLLALVQTGMYLGYMQNASSVIDHSRADLWVMREGTENFDVAQPMDEKYVYKVWSVPGVARVEKMILGVTYWKTPKGGTEGPEVIGLEPYGKLLQPWNLVEGDLSVLQRDRSVIMDRMDMAKLGIEKLGTQTELWEERAVIRGFTEGIRSFITAPVIFTSLKDAHRFCRIPEDQVVYLLIQVSPGASAVAVRDAIRKAVPHVASYTRKEFSERTRSYWSRTTGVGVALFTSALLGVLVGISVVALTLYMTISDQLKEYGTLKAIGVSNSKIISLIGYQSLLLGGVGAGIGWAVAFGMTQLIVASGINVVLPLSVGLQIVCSIVVLCFFSSFLAAQKVLKLEPAIVFER